MQSVRLNFALETGAFALPEAGRIAVFRPRAGDDLSALPKDRVRIISGFKPDVDHFAKAGFAVETSAAPADAALVCLPRAKAEARAVLAAAVVAVPPGATVIVDGQKTDGVDAIYKDLRARVAVTEAVAKAHGKIFAFAAGPQLADWAAAPQQVVDGFTTAPGVFSADGPDRGSALLAAALPAKFPSRVVDLGAGWGYLSHHILQRPGVKELHLVEAEKAALDCARINIQDDRAQFHWADATSWQVPHLAGAVVCNPPFHTGRDADPALGVAFIRAAAKMLAPDGTLWLVANRHLPYDPALRALFRELEEIGGDGAFRLVRASFPSRR